MFAVGFHYTLRLSGIFLKVSQGNIGVNVLARKMGCSVIIKKPAFREIGSGIQFPYEVMCARGERSSFQKEMGF